MKAGDKLGRFELVRSLGKGSHGVVFEARDTMLGERVAIKALHPWLTGDATLRERFKRELILTRRVSHPGVCRLHDLHEEDDNLFISMQFVDGRTLSQVIKADRPGPSRCVTILRGICGALAAAHESGVIHRDLKPGNVLVGNEDRVVVLDFGIATAAGVGQLTSPGQALGSVPFIPLEVWEGGTASAVGDQYALGVMGFASLTRELPYTGKNPLEIVDALRGPRPSMRARNPEVDDELEAAVMRAMAVRAEDRYPNVVAFDEVLAAWQRSSAARLVASFSGAPTSRGEESAPATASSSARELDPLTAASVVVELLPSQVLGPPADETRSPAPPIAGGDSEAELKTVPARRPALDAAPTIDAAPPVAPVPDSLGPDSLGPDRLKPDPLGPDPLGPREPSARPLPTLPAAAPRTQPDALQPTPAEHTTEDPVRALPHTVEVVSAEPPSGTESAAATEPGSADHTAVAHVGPPDRLSPPTETELVIRRPLAENEDVVAAGVGRKHPLGLFAAALGGIAVVAFVALRAPGDSGSVDAGVAEAGAAAAAAGGPGAVVFVDAGGAAREAGAPADAGTGAVAQAAVDGGAPVVVDAGLVITELDLEKSAPPPVAVTNRGVSDASVRAVQAEGRRKGLRAGDVPAFDDAIAKGIAAAKAGNTAGVDDAAKSARAALAAVVVDRAFVSDKLARYNRAWDSASNAALKEQLKPLSREVLGKVAKKDWAAANATLNDGLNRLARGR